MGKIQWSLLVSLWCKTLFFVQVFVFLFLSSSSPSCRSHAAVCSLPHASVCRFETSPCVPATHSMLKACGRVPGTHWDASNRHTEACWDLHTAVFSVLHNTTQHKTRQRKAKRSEGERGDRREKREKKRKIKTEEEKERKKRKTGERTRKGEKREDEIEDEVQDKSRCSELFYY